jgi:hypothetical protein
MGNLVNCFICLLRTKVIALSVGYYCSNKIETCCCCSGKDDVCWAQTTRMDRARTTGEVSSCLPLLLQLPLLQLDLLKSRMMWKQLPNRARRRVEHPILLKHCSRLTQVRFLWLSWDAIGLDLDWIGLDWIRLDKIGLDLKGPLLVVYRFVLVVVFSRKLNKWKKPNENRRLHLRYLHYWNKDTIKSRLNYNLKNWFGALKWILKLFSYLLIVFWSKANKSVLLKNDVQLICLNGTSCIEY